MSKVRSGISIGTILFWGFLGWMLFGDFIRVFFRSNVEIKVQDEKIEVDVDKTISDLKTKINDAKDKIVKEFEKKQEEKPNSDEGRVMTVKDDIEDNNDFKSDDRYGDYDNSDKY